MNVTDVATRPAVQPFRVTVTRYGRKWAFDVRGTHDMLHRLCDRIDDGRGLWGERFGPLYYEATRDGYAPRNGAPTEYDDRDAADYIGAVPVRVA